MCVGDGNWGWGLFSSAVDQSEAMEPGGWEGLGGSVTAQAIAHPVGRAAFHRPKATKEFPPKQKRAGICLAWLPALHWIFHTRTHVGHASLRQSLTRQDGQQTMGVPAAAGQEGGGPGQNWAGEQGEAPIGCCQEEKLDSMKVGNH